MWSDVVAWAGTFFAEQASPGIINTAILTQTALVATCVMSMVMFPMISPKFFDPVSRNVGHVGLAVIRSTPEYVLALVYLLLWEPSMRPAVGFNRYFYDVLPWLYP